MRSSSSRKLNTISKVPLGSIFSRWWSPGVILVEPKVFDEFAQRRAGEIRTEQHRTYPLLAATPGRDNRTKICGEFGNNAVVRTLAKGRRNVFLEGPARLVGSLSRTWTSHPVMACASAIPPSALTTTTTSGGARQTVRRTKQTRAIPKSPGVLTELVQTGL
jgi:hypothetical protein